MTTFLPAKTFPLDRAEATAFPGRWTGGVSLVLGPLLVLAGVLLRIGPDMFFPHQLAAYAAEPTRIFAAYSCFLLGGVALWPGIVLLARKIGERSPGLALWGGLFTIFGLFARTFHSGLDHLAFRLVDVLGVETATRVVAESYGAFHVMRLFSVPLMIGCLLLGIGAWRSGERVRAVALALATAMPIGMLKGTEPLSVVGAAGLCVALMPLGFEVLGRGPRPATGPVVRWSVLVIGVIAAMWWLGQAG